MTEVKQEKPIDLNSQYSLKVRAGILIPKKAHENFEEIKAEVKQIKDLVNQVLSNFNK